jgi:hypothetical protein
LCSKKKRIISDKDEDNVSDPPSKKVRMSESDTLEQETDEKYIVLITNLMIILTGRLTSLHPTKSYAPFFRLLKKGKARDISKNAEVFEDDNNTNNVSDDWHKEELQFAIGQSWYVGLTKFKSSPC